MPISFETAKKLKEVGYPQGEEILDVYLPRLEELILACGTDFMRIEKRADGQWASMANIPETKRCSNCPSAQTAYLIINEDISEAVALLYLQLKTL